SHRLLGHPFEVVARLVDPGLGGVRYIADVSARPLASLGVSPMCLCHRGLLVESDAPDVVLRSLAVSTLRRDVIMSLKRQPVGPVPTLWMAGSQPPRAVASGGWHARASQRSGFSCTPEPRMPGDKPGKGPQTIRRSAVRVAPPRWRWRRSEPGLPQAFRS